jgi:hypothetical protein
MGLHFILCSFSSLSYFVACFGNIFANALKGITTVNTKAVMIEATKIFFIIFSV